jgi:prevent-host-death family protein
MIPISEARAQLATLVDEASRGAEPCFIAAHSRVKAVLLGIDEYDALLERLEDLADSVEVLRGRLEAEPTRPLDDFAREIEVARQDDVSRRA